jgi:hypothetical protein
VTHADADQPARQGSTPATGGIAYSRGAPGRHRRAVRWLARGWDDFRQTGMRGAFYGVVFALMGSLIALVYATRWQLTMGLTAGFFLIGPFVCTGIYELSRQRARGEPADPASQHGLLETQHGRGRVFCGHPHFRDDRLGARVGRAVRAVLDHRLSRPQRA